MSIVDKALSVAVPTTPEAAHRMGGWDNTPPCALAARWPCYRRKSMASWVSQPISNNAC